jgi:hypothetical protein
MLIFLFFLLFRMLPPQQTPPLPQHAPPSPPESARAHIDHSDSNIIHTHRVESGDTQLVASRTAMPAAYLQTRKTQTLNPKPPNPNPKHLPSTPKSPKQTSNPKHQTPNIKPQPQTKVTGHSLHIHRNSSPYPLRKCAGNSNG